MERQFITVSEACQILGISRPTFYELLNRGEISAIKLGRKLIINIEHFEKTFGVKVPTK